jgi:hypothetical protein
MRRQRHRWRTRPGAATGGFAALLVLPLVVAAEEPATSSYLPVAIGEGFPTIMARMKAAKPAVETRQADLLAERHDPSNRPAQGVMMSRGKALQGRRRP